MSVEMQDLCALPRLHSDRQAKVLAGLRHGTWNRQEWSRQGRDGLAQLTREFTSSGYI